MQGNDYGILVKTIKKIPKINFSASRTGSHFWQNQICTLQHDREFVMFRFYFPLFIKLFMVLLKASDIYARNFEYSCMRCLCTTENNRRGDKNCERGYSTKNQ